MYYVPEEDNVTTKTLKLYLRYQLTGIDDSSTEEGAETSEAWANDYTVKYSDAVYVSLSSLLAQYENAHGEKPENWKWITNIIITVTLYRQKIPIKNELRR